MIALLLFWMAAAVHSPTGLVEEMERISHAARGNVGVAALVVETGESAVLHGDRRFPMQSVYKLPIAMAALHQTDLGLLGLEQKVSLKKDDLVPTPTHSPIRENYPERGLELSVYELLRFAMVESDGTASDALLRLAGGPQAVNAYMRELDVNGIVVATSEREMTRDEDVQYRNWAEPVAMAGLLRVLYEGRALSAPSRALLLQFMMETGTGPCRIKGRLPPGTIVAHKTGTSSTIQGLTRATNDAGLVTLPDGRHIAVVVFISDSTDAEAVRDGLIAQIARAAWDWYGREPR